MDSSEDQLYAVAEFGATILRRIASACRRVWLISPYITNEAVVAAATASGAPSRRLVTRFDGADILAGVSDLRVLGALQAASMNVRTLVGVHAKVYVLDDWVYVGSANLTKRGLEHSLREFGRASEVPDDVASATTYFETLWADAVDLSTEAVGVAIVRLGVLRLRLERFSEVERHAARELVDGLQRPRPLAVKKMRRPTTAGIVESSNGSIGADDIVEFRDVSYGSHHNLFMNWRRGSEDGFYLNMHSEQRAMMHVATCTHQGKYDFGKNPGSATRDRKVCSRNIATLYSWAREREVRVRLCSTCKPPLH